MHSLNAGKMFARIKNFEKAIVYFEKAGKLLLIKKVIRLRKEIFNIFFMIKV